MLAILIGCIAFGFALGAIIAIVRAILSDPVAGICCIVLTALFAFYLINLSQALKHGD